MNAEAFMDLLRIMVLILVFLRTLRLIVPERRSIHLVFYVFAVACILLSDLYWLAYDLLRPETRMPFAANEIGEWAMFLLLAVSLGTPERSGLKHAKWEVLCTGLFVIASVGLWIAWSGEWVQDILTGLSYGAFLCRLASRIKEENALSDWDWRRLGIACVVLIVAQASIFVAPEAVRGSLDLFCYILLFLGSVCFLVRAMLSVRKDEPGQTVCHTFAYFAWVVTVMYMSSGQYYLLAMLLSMLSFPLMLLALRKEAASG